MSTQEQARALMMRHHHLVKNRQQSSVARRLKWADSVDINKIQGKLIPPSASFMTAVQLR